MEAGIHSGTVEEPNPLHRTEAHAFARSGSITTVSATVGERPFRACPELVEGAA